MGDETIRRCDQIARSRHHSGAAMLRRCDAEALRYARRRGGTRRKAGSSVVLNVVSYVGFRQLSRISKQNDTCRNNGVEVCWYNQCRASAPARALVAQKMNNLRTTSPLAKATAYTPRADVCTSHHEFHIVPSAPSQSEHRCRQRQVTHERASPPQPVHSPRSVSAPWPSSTTPPLP